MMQTKKVMTFEDPKQRAYQWKKAIETLQNRWFLFIFGLFTHSFSCTLGIQEQWDSPEEIVLFKKKTPTRCTTGFFSSFWFYVPFFFFSRFSLHQGIYLVNLVVFELTFDLWDCMSVQLCKVWYKVICSQGENDKFV